MGVISDTSPSLEYTLQQLGIAKYFTSFTASSLVGAGKPREQGFTSFLIDRDGKNDGKWSIQSLRQLIEFAEKG